MKLSPEAAAVDIGSKRGGKQLPPSPENGGAARGNKWRRAMASPKPKPRRMWTAAEESALQKGVLKHGAGKWKKIHGDLELPFVRNNRSSVDLKDKWRVMVRKMTKGQGDGVSSGTVVGSSATECSPSPCSQQGTPLSRDAQPGTKLTNAALRRVKSAAETDMLTPSGAVAGNNQRKRVGVGQGRRAADRIEGKRRVVNSERMQGAQEKQQGKARRRGKGELPVKLEPAGLSPNRFVTGCADGTRADTDSDGGIPQLQLGVSAANTSLAIDGQPPTGFKSVPGSSPRARSTSSSPRSPALPTAVLGLEISAAQAVKLAASRVSGPRRKFFAVQWDEPSHADHDVWYIARVARPAEGQNQPPSIEGGRSGDAEQSAPPTPAARASPEALASGVSKSATQQLDLPAGWCLLEFKADFVVEEAFHLAKYAKLGRVRTLKSHPANARTARAATPAAARVAVGKGKGSSSTKLKARPAASAGGESGAKRAKTCTDAGQPGKAQSLCVEGVDRTRGLEAAAPTGLDLAAQLSVQLPPSPAVEQPAGHSVVGTDSLHNGHASLTNLHLTLPNGGDVVDASGYAHEGASLRLDLQSTAGLHGPSAAVATASAGGAAGGGTLNGGVSENDWLAGCAIGNTSTAVVCDPDELAISDTVNGNSGNSIGTSAASNALAGGQLDSLLHHGGETTAVSFGDTVAESGAMSLELGSFGSATGAGDSADLEALSSDVHADEHAAAAPVDWSRVNC